jgi:hypothetical protein
LAVTDTILLALVLAGLCACTPEGPLRAPARLAKTTTTDKGERAYRQPPAVLGADLQAGGRMVVFGLADPGARVRLAMPSGRAALFRADPSGRWQVSVANVGAPRLFGLSMQEDGRIVQSDGYLALAPGGPAVRLRPGAGALVLGEARPLWITALDYDRKGGSVVSGHAAPGGQVGLWVDGVSSGTTAADGDGRFFFDLGEPLGPGPHAILARSASRTASVDVRVEPPPPLTGGPFATAPAGEGWRIVWLTPGGGLQTTVIFQGPEARA